MFYLFLISNCYLIYKLYKRYFKVNLLIILGFILLDLIIIFFNLYNTISNSIFFYYILVLLYLSFIIDIKEMWISDLTIIGILLINILKLIIDYFIYNKQIVYEGVAFIIIFIVIIILIEIILTKELIGFGDLKLFFVLSINHNFYDVIVLLFLSSLIGIIYYFIFKKLNYFPFGPAIIISFIVVESVKMLVD